MARTVTFDVLGTLFSLGRLRAALHARRAADPALELWFGQSLRDYFGLSHAGGYVPLKQILEAGLPRALQTVGADTGEKAREDIMSALSQLEPAPGAEDAVRRLSEAGYRLVALSNGSLESTEQLLDGAGLRERFDAVRSCDEVETSKPARRAYELATEGATGEVWMIAAHAWDIAGAQRAGLRTIWVATVEPEYLSAYPPPDMVADDLAGAADRLLASAA